MCDDRPDIVLPEPFKSGYGRIYLVDLVYVNRIR